MLLKLQLISAQEIQLLCSLCCELLLEEGHIQVTAGCYEFVGGGSMDFGASAMTISVRTCWKTRHKNKPDQISPKQSTSSLPHTYTLCRLAAIKQHLPSTHPNALIYWSLTGGLQQEQVALQANPATVIDTATIRRLNTASIPEKPWLRGLWKKINSSQITVLIFKYNLFY